MKILKGENLFSKFGTHVLDEKGIAIQASEDTECNILPEHLDRVKFIVEQNRKKRGLDAEGHPIVEDPESSQEEAL